MILLALLCFLCLFMASHADAAVEPQRLANSVTIYRDKYGVPHVFGRTDASTAFGFAYAQAEDNFWRVEENFIHALGRASELYGERSLEEDRLNRVLEIPRLAGRIRAPRSAYAFVVRAFAAGFNFYLERHPEAHPRLLTKIEPWYTLAFIRYNYYQNGFARDRSLRRLGLQTAQADNDLREHTGSNGWVIGPSKSATATRCCSSILTCRFLVPARFTKDTSTATRVGIYRLHTVRFSVAIRWSQR